MLSNKRFTFLSRFERKQIKVIKTSNRNYQKIIYLFKNVRFKEDNTFFIPHIWIYQNKGIMSLGNLFEYDMIEFDARVVEYEPNKYTLKNPNKIKLFDRFNKENFKNKKKKTEKEHIQDHEKVSEKKVRLRKKSDAG
jgi:predicted DNA-binding protein (UPF0278 family)